MAYDTSFSTFDGMRYAGSGIAPAAPSAPRPVVRAAPQAVAPNVNGARPGDAQLAGMLKKATANYQAETKARYEKLMGMAQQFGAAQTAQSNQLLGQQQAQGQASLIDRGLGNSTVVDAVSQQAQDMNQRRLLDINERSNAIQMGVVQDQVPQAPDYSMYANLFAAQRTGGQPLTNSLPLFNLFSQPAVKGKIAA